MKVRAYIILGTHKKTGEIVGLYENSLTYTINKNRVMIHNRYAPHTYYGKMYTKILKEDGVLKNNSLSVNQFHWRILKKEYIRDIKKKYHQFNFKIYRINSKHCPVKIDYREVVAMYKKYIPFKKYHAINLPFILKEKAIN